MIRFHFKAMSYKSLSIFLFLVISALLMTACAGSPASQPRETTALQKLTIDFSTQPSEIKSGQEAELITRVSQGSTPIKDALVEVEIWRDGDTNRVKVKAQPDGKGGYLVKMSFPEKGLYHATLHTTTNEVHQMPTVEFQVK